MKGVDYHYLGFGVVMLVFEALRKIKDIWVP